MAKENKNIVILSDFTESAWESVRFSFDKLMVNNHGLAFIQTYRRSGFGQSLFKNMVPVLKQIVKNDLLDLKFKTLRHFKIEEQKVSIHPFEGDWRTVFYNNHLFGNDDFLVFSLKEAFPGAENNLSAKVCKLAINTTVPLFILPYPLQPGNFKRVLFLLDEKRKNTPKIRTNDGVLTVIQNALFDFRLASANMPENNKDMKLADICGLKPETKGIISPKEQSDYLTGSMEHDIIIIDQALIKSSDNDCLKLQKWVENKNGVPILIF